MSDIVAISAFGINDSIYFQDKSYSLSDYLPNVVIEDDINNLYLYDFKAKEDRTDIGFFRPTTSRLNVNKPLRTPVSVLWQQLHDLKYDEKFKVAKRIAQYIENAVCYFLKKDGLSDEILKSLSYVICIPNNYGETEQQALIDSFPNREVKLIWRGIASVLANMSELTIRKPKTIGILYMGLDAIEYSYYDLKEKDGYLVPVRTKAIYDKAIDHNLFDLAFNLIDSHIDLNLSSIRSQDEEQEQSLSRVMQVAYRCPDVWSFMDGKSYDSKRKSVICYSDDGKWCYWCPIISDLRTINTKLKISNSFRERYGLGSLNSSYLLGTLGAELGREIENSNEDNVLFCGPILYNKLISRIRYNTRDVEYSESARGSESMAFGAYVFGQRLTQGKATYEDKLNPLYIITNTDEEYQWHEIISKDKTVEAGDEYIDDVQGLFIQKDAEKLEIYLSNDNQPENLDDAVKSSFADLNKEVYILLYKFKKIATKNEQVTLQIRTKPLSGFATFNIKTENSDFLPREGISLQFNKNTSKRFKDKLRGLNLSYSRFKDIPYKKVTTTDISSVLSMLKGSLTNNINKNDLELLKNEMYLLQNNPANYNVKANVSALLLDLSVKLRKKRKFNESGNTFIGFIRCGASLLSNKDIMDFLDNCIAIEKHFNKVSDYNYLQGLNYALEYNRKAFDPGSKDYSMSLSYAETLFYRAKLVLQDVIEHDSEEFNNITRSNRAYGSRPINIKGCYKFTVAARAILYSLFVRKKHQDFLTSKFEIDNVMVQLNDVLNSYKKVYETIKNKSNNGKEYLNNLQRLKKKVDNLNKIVEIISDYINKKGNNENIFTYMDLFADKKEDE